MLYRCLKKVTHVITQQLNYDDHNERFISEYWANFIIFASSRFFAAPIFSDNVISRPDISLNMGVVKTDEIERRRIRALRRREKRTNVGESLDAALDVVLLMSRQPLAT